MLCLVCLHRMPEQCEKTKQKKNNEKKGLLVRPPVFKHDRERPFFERGSDDRRVKCRYCEVEMHNISVNKSRHCSTPKHLEKIKENSNIEKKG